MGSFCLEDSFLAPASPEWEPSERPRSFCERAAMALFDPNGALVNRMVCLCAEPGTGRREILTCALSTASRQGVQVIRRNLEGYSPEAAARYLAKKARHVERLGGLVVVALDAIPASDELCVARQARALRRMWEGGASVVFSIAPEARQLLEELPECREVSLQSLFSYGAASLSDGFSRELLSFSRAIPSLIVSIAARKESDSHGGEGGAVLLPSYYDSLGELAELSVRSGLADEERQLRLGMLLLGRGSREDLAEVTGRAPMEVLEDIRRYAPLFGLSEDLEGFVTLPSVVSGAYPICLRHLLASCSLYPGVVARCLALLTRRGELGRAAVLARVPECDAASETIMERGAAFIDAGEVELVRHVIGLSGGQGGAVAESLRAAVSAVSDTRPCLGEKGRAPASPVASNDALLLVDARRVLRGLPLLTGENAPAESELGRALSLHVGAVSLMARGEFTRALGLLAGGYDDGAGPRLATALLTLDRDSAYLLAGGIEGAEIGRSPWAEELVESRPFSGLWGYAALHRMVCSQLCADAEVACDLDAIASRSERSGDAIVRIVALIFGSMRDAERNAGTRARVRASLAAELSLRIGATYLHRVADLVGQVVRHLAGEPVEPRVCDAAGDDLEAVASLVLESISNGSGPLLLSALPDRIPWDAVWLLRALCAISESLSSLIIENAPAGWRRVLSASHRPERRPDDSASALPAPPPSPRESSLTSGAGASERPVEIKMLGGFSLSVNGKHVPDWKLERRYIKSMLEFLVLQGGSSRRFQLVEQLWPGCDYAMGFNRAYQTTSAIRASVAEIDKDISLIVVNRTNGEVSIDMGLVRCDVDEFRRAARIAVDSDDDEETLGAARTVERLYEGDLYVPSVDSTGRIAALRAEFRALYADAMIEGSAAALRLGRARTSARLAGNALAANDIREDAVIALVRALTACGRTIEADRQHRAFEMRMAKARSRRSASSGPLGPGEEGPRRRREVTRRKEMVEG